jgi:hypothetical protein
MIMQTIRANDRTDIMRIARHMALACLLPAIAMSAAHAESTAQAQANYQKEKADCLNGQTAEGKKTCLREAGAALNDAKSGRLDKTNTGFEQNALARCQVFKNEDDRGLCERRQREGTVTGSVAGGGDLRELTVTVPVDTTPAQPTSMPQPGAMPPQDSMPQDNMQHNAK